VKTHAKLRDEPKMKPMPEETLQFSAPTLTPEAAAAGSLSIAPVNKVSAAQPANRNFFITLPLCENDENGRQDRSSSSNPGLLDEEGITM